MATLEHDATNDQRLKDLQTTLDKLGKAEGQGDNSRPQAAIAAVEAAMQGVVGPDDAEACWETFQKAAAKARSIPYTREPSFKVQKSKFKNFLTVGSIPGLDALDVMSRTRDVMKALAADDATKKALKGSVYDGLIKIAREQIKREADPMTDDDIRSTLLAGKEQSDPDEIKELEAIRKRIEKVHEKFPTSGDALERANNILLERVAELTSVQEQDNDVQQMVALLSKESVRAAFPGLLMADAAE